MFFRIRIRIRLACRLSQAGFDDPFDPKSAWLSDDSDRCLAGSDALMERARDVEIFVVSRAPPGIDSYVVIGAVLGACRIFTGDGDRVSVWWRKIQPTVQEELDRKSVV